MTDMGAPRRFAHAEGAKSVFVDELKARLQDGRSDVIAHEKINSDGLDTVRAQLDSVRSASFRLGGT
jgi:hypothetical protein